MTPKQRYDERLLRQREDDMNDLVERLRDLAKSCGWEHGTPTGQTAFEAAAEIERLRIELDEQHELRARAEAERGEACEGLAFADQNRTFQIARAEAAEAEIERLRSKLAEAEKVIAPFAECGRSHTDEHGWIDGFGNERLCNWIGPSDLRAAAEWMEKGDE